MTTTPMQATGAHATSGGRRLPPPPRRRPIIIERNSPVHIGLVAVGLAIVVALIAWASGMGQFNQGQLTRVIIYAIAIAGLNMATGYTGLVSVGHSAFFGLGAYTTGVLVVKYGWHAEYTIPVAFVICFVVGLVVGLPALRIRGLYLAMVTLAFGVAFPEVVARLEWLTGGPEGLTIRRRMLQPLKWSGFTLGQKGRWLFWIAVVMLIVVMLLVHNIARGRYGLALMAARDNEIAAAASGINLAAVKTGAFGLSGALTGVGGSLFAIYLGSLVANDSFTLLNAIALLTGLVVGGSATRFGPIVGAFAVVYIPYYTSDIGRGQFAAVMFGATLIAIIFLAPEGLTGGAFRIIRRFLWVVPKRRPSVAPANRTKDPETARPTPST